MQAKEIQPKLKSLRQEASSIDPCLARKLDEINRWVKDVKPGSLTAKKFVMAFLLEVIRDSKVWLKIKALPSQEEQQSKFEQMTPSERYWYSYLFPKWLSQTDPKFWLWKQKLMAGEFNQADDHVIKSIATEIVQRECTFWHCYVVDLSMATDLIVSSSQKKPLCIQVTSISEEFLQQKYADWENTLQNWGINRGLFLSYNPRISNFVNQLVNIALDNSDNLRVGSYLKFP
ncbi:MAG: hypothetical protein U7123_15575 [Potamolinea sp.]